MQDEALQMVPRAERPTAEELMDYSPQYEHDEEDYTDVRSQLGVWLYDHRRRQDEERENRDGRVPFEEDETMRHGNAHGYEGGAEGLEAIRSAIQGAPSRPRR